MKAPLLALAVLVAGGFSVLRAEDSSGSKILKPSSFTEARRAEIQEITSTLNKRDLMRAEGERLKAQRQKLADDDRERSTALENLRQELVQAESEVASLKKEDTPDTSKVKNAEDKVESLKEKIQDAPRPDEHLADKLKALDDQIAQNDAQVTLLLGTLSGLLSGENSFRQSTSETFAFLIGIVIVAFFFIAFKDEKVRQNIFTGESGLQFITIFSLIIAIILFGISGILEGKELSALLGGLSGYILGRSGRGGILVNGGGGGGTGTAPRATEAGGTTGEVAGGSGTEAGKGGGAGATPAGTAAAGATGAA